MAAQKRAKRKPDAAALEMLKASGILNRNITLDQLMKLSAKLNDPRSSRTRVYLRTLPLPRLLIRRTRAVTSAGAIRVTAGLDQDPGAQAAESALAAG